NRASRSQSCSAPGVGTAISRARSDREQSYRPVLPRRGTKEQSREPTLERDPGQRSCFTSQALITEVLRPTGANFKVRRGSAQEAIAILTRSHYTWTPRLGGAAGGRPARAPPLSFRGTDT